MPITQISGPAVAIDGGVSLGAPLTIGTNDAQPLIFETSGTERARFTATGELVVIGPVVTINSTVVDIADRLVHVNSSTGANDPAPSLITGLGVHRGAVAGVPRDHAAVVWDEPNNRWNFAFNTGGDDITLGADQTVKLASLLASGNIRQLTNNSTISGRNAAGMADVEIARVNASDEVSIAAGGANVVFGGGNIQSVGAGNGSVTFHANGNGHAQLHSKNGALSLETQGGAIEIGTTNHSRTISIGTGGGASVQAITIGGSNASSLTLHAGTGAINIGTSADARSVNIATGAAAQTIQIGSAVSTSSITSNFGSNGFGLVQAVASSGTPVGVAMSAAAHAGIAVAEATDVNFNLARPVTFGAGGTLVSQRAFRVQGPTYAAASALSITNVATLSVGQPVSSTNVSFATGATGPTLPSDSGTAGGLYNLTQAPAISIEGTTANAALGVALVLRNNASNATALPSIGWQSNAGSLDGTLGFQTGNAFNHQRFVLAIRANSTLSPALSISSQGGYRFANSAPNDPSTTPAGFLFSGTANGGVNTYAATVEATQFAVDSSQTYTFAAGGIATQRSALFRAPTYAFAGASTVADTATVAVTAAPIAGANASFTRSMALWVQAGLARFDGGIGVAVSPSGAVQGVGACFRKSLDPAAATYPNGVSTVTGGAYTPATGYRSVVPAFWTLPAAIVDGGTGLPLNPGIRFTFSDGTTVTRTNTNTAAPLTEIRGAVDLGKDGVTIVAVDFVVNNTTGGAVAVNFGAWTTDGHQF